MVGNVTVDSTGQFYREYEYNGKRVKESMYSPYTQVVRHCELLKKIRSTGHSKLGNFIIDNLSGMEAFKPLVVFSNSKGILNTKYAPKEIKDSVIRVDQLINYINKDINNISYDYLSSQKDLESFANVWLSRSITNNISIADKYKKLLNIDSKLEERLREFRKQKSKKMNVPAYYIFNDEEMFNIIKYKPKTIEQLTELNIFSKIKLQYHGKDIIDVLNKGDDK